MQDPDDRPDTSSIQSISSLRSRFENLNKDNPNPLVSEPQKPGGAKLGGAYSSLHTSRERNGAALADCLSPGDSRSPILEGRQARSATRERPKSMISIGTSPPKPPHVIVESPRSTTKTLSVDLRPVKQPDFNGASLNQLANLNTNNAASSGSTSTDSPSTPLRTNQAAATTFTHLANSTSRMAVAAGKQTPPSINRASKPKVPQKPRTLSPYPAVDFNSDNNGVQGPNDGVSPFNTPPSSAQPSPDKESGFQNYEPLFPSRVTSKQPQRNGSDSQSTSITANGVTPTVKKSYSSQPQLWSETNSRSSTLNDSPSPNENDKNARTVFKEDVFADRSDKELVSYNENKPKLPIRAETRPSHTQRDPPRTGSLRTSPVQKPSLTAPRSMDGLERAAARSRTSINPSFPPEKVAQYVSSPIDYISPKSKLPPPTVPPPRRSMDRRPELSSLTAISPAVTAPEPEVNHTFSTVDNSQGQSEFPNASQTNRRPPRYRRRPQHIATEYDTRLAAVCGEIVCTSGYITKAWNWQTGEQVLHMAHGENVRVTAMVFKPSARTEDEGRYVWLGTNIGEIHEIDIAEQTLVRTKTGAHSRREILRMYRYAAELWSLDETGDLNVWKPGKSGLASLDSQYRTFRLPRGHTFSIACGPELWLATGKQLQVVRPSARSEAELFVLKEPLIQNSAGDVTCGTTLSSRPDLLYFGHSDGKVSIYSKSSHSCLGVVTVSANRIGALAGVGEYLWAGFSNGTIYVYDPAYTPWMVKKEWKAHEKQICSMIVDPSAIWKADRLQVVSLGTDNSLRFWDGTLQEDWLDSHLHEHDKEFCSFGEMTAAVLTWNAGASKPTYLQHSIQDSGFFQDYIRNVGPSPDIFVFGFQELVDLEDKKLTAKSFFKSKKKDSGEQEHMSHQYRVWRDHLTRCIGDYTPTGESYVLLHTASLIGLFTCIFIKAKHRSRIRHIHGSEIKRGMGGLHGNKGALLVRMIVDDTSLCLINCHLAAGQTQTIQRNNDAAAILEAECLPAYPLSNDDPAQHSDIFVSGGDGSMILDHEICILNGDLNYRIDTMGRDTVVKHVLTDNLNRLLDRDQLLLSRRKNPGFRLRVFQENPITFAPTYKYNVRSEEYDTSEKRRAPAWCDRILYRGKGRVTLRDYRRWEVHVSDHRPVSGYLQLRVKSVDPQRRVAAWNACEQEFAVWRAKLTRNVQLAYLTDTLGLSREEATAALRNKA